MPEATFSCTACGRRYPFRADLAGRKVRCKCGQVVQVPMTAQAAAAAPASLAVAPAAPPPMPAAAPAGPRCPSCGSALAAGAVLCIQCGYNLQTGARIGTALGGDVQPAPAPMAMPAPAAAPAFIPGVPLRSRDAAREQAERSATIKKVAIGAVLVLAIAGIVVGARFYMKRSSGPSGPMLGQDARAMTMLSEDRPIEARAFIEGHESRMLGIIWTRRQALDKIDNWYKMGAKKVWAFTALISRNVVIELPSDPAQRKELFDWAKRWDEENARKPQTDVGQKYLVIDL